MRWKSLILLSFIVDAAYGFSVLEPSIECTVIKVVSTTAAFDQSEFPKLYQSINNDPVNSILNMAGKRFLKVKPKTVFKTQNYEKISIDIENNTFELQLNGKPISRNGTLAVNGKLLAKVTCH
ncbi:MAG: hypothetical protein JNM24_16205 [Bdellovibrionaceae bacterium]|nr:hypothetical protein [Pseudobdellovibrionaceae bacterium]